MVYVTNFCTGRMSLVKNQLWKVYACTSFWPLYQTAIDAIFLMAQGIWKSNKIRFYFMVTWGITAGKNHHWFFASFISKTGLLFTGSQSLMEPYQNSRWHHRWQNLPPMYDWRCSLHFKNGSESAAHFMLPHSIMDYPGTYWVRTGHDISFC